MACQTSTNEKQCDSVTSLQIKEAKMSLCDLITDVGIISISDSLAGIDRVSLWISSFESR